MQYELNNIIRIFREQHVLGVIKKSILYIKFPFSLFKFRNGAQEHGPEALVDFAYNACSGLIKPLQVKNEILRLLPIANEQKPKTILEIGSAVGGNLFLFTQIATRDALVISIDLPGGKFGGGYPAWRIPLYKLFVSGKQRLRLIRADSHDVATKEAVQSALNNKEIDFLFIDGDHTYNGVKKDFEMYSPLVRNNGIIALHDIVPHEQKHGCGADKFWNEIKSNYVHEEIVNNWNQKWAGIGVIKKKC